MRLSSVIVGVFLFVGNSGIDDDLVTLVDHGCWLQELLAVSIPDEDDRVGVTAARLDLRENPPQSHPTSISISGPSAPGMSAKSLFRSGSPRPRTPTPGAKAG